MGAAGSGGGMGMGMGGMGMGMGATGAGTGADRAPNLIDRLNAKRATLPKKRGRM